MSSFLDPANLANTRSGGISIAGILDPIGQTLSEQGIDMPYRKDLANYVNMPGDPAKPTASGNPLSAAARRTSQAKKDKLSRYRALRRPVQGGSIMVAGTELENFK